VVVTAGFTKNQNFWFACLFRTRESSQHNC